jgi:hypothetical protein
MLCLDYETSSPSSQDGGPVRRITFGEYSALSLAVGPSRWGRNNVRKGFNYGIADTPDGIRSIQKLVATNLKDAKVEIAALLKGKITPVLERSRAYGFRRFEENVKLSAPEVKPVIERWSLKHADMRRVQKKAQRLLTGRMEKAYEQLSLTVCRLLSEKKVSTLAIEDSFLKYVAEHPMRGKSLALRQSMRYRHAAGLSVFIRKLKHAAQRLGITIVEHRPENTSRLCAFCGADLVFGKERKTTCSACSHVVDIDENAARNLRLAELRARSNAETVAPVPETPMFTWEFSIARVDRNGVERQKRNAVITIDEEAA